MSAVIYPDDLAVMSNKKKIKRQLRNGNTIRNENRLVCKDGTIKWISIKAQLFQESENAQFFCVFVDITEEETDAARNQELYKQELTNFARLSSKEGVSRDNKCYTRTGSKGICPPQRRRSPMWGYLMIDHSQPGGFRCGSLRRAKDFSGPWRGKRCWRIMRPEKPTTNLFFFEEHDGKLLLEQHEIPLLPESGKWGCHHFLYTTDVTEQKLQEILLQKK